MFEKLFKNSYKSRKSVSPEEAEVLNQETKRLNEDTKLREAQIINLKNLTQEDPVNRERYEKRILVHYKHIEDNNNKVKEIEIKLLDS
tara:strand:+ start:189 stop:452 length:264 start_codon:yes stop_codon:yes gene_type:complete